MTSKASGVLFQQRETDLFCFVYKSLCIQHEALLTPVLGADLLITPFCLGHLARFVAVNERSSVFAAHRICFGSSSALCSEQNLLCPETPGLGDGPCFTSPKIGSSSPQGPCRAPSPPRQRAGCSAWFPAGIGGSREGGGVSGLTQPSASLLALGEPPQGTAGSGCQRA